MRIGLTENIRMREITRNANARGSTVKEENNPQVGAVSFNTLHKTMKSQSLKNAK